jgi:hypothetical protein
MPDFNFSLARAYAFIIDGISEKHPTHPAHVAPNLRSGVGDMGGVFFFLPFHRACAREISDKRLVKISRRERKISRRERKTSRPLVNVVRPRRIAKRKCGIIMAYNNHICSGGIFFSFRKREMKFYL